MDGVDSPWTFGLDPFGKTRKSAILDPVYSRSHYRLFGLSRFVMTFNLTTILLSGVFIRLWTNVHFVFITLTDVFIFYIYTQRIVSSVLQVSF